jgi:hypothetical protein
MQEIYKDVQGFEGLYQVSNLGNVKSLKTHNKKEKLLTQENVKSKDVNYKRVKLHKEGSYKRFLVHRLVAMHFIPNPDSKPQVNHIDNNTSNNVVSNLEWCTGAENMKHSRDQGRQNKVTELAIKAMIKANIEAVKPKYEALVNKNLNGRILLSYVSVRKPNGKPRYKGNFECVNCCKKFTAEMDSSIKNINNEKPSYCRSCTHTLRVKI